MADHPPHPAADIFPMLPEAELRALADDIRKRGRLLHPIVLDPEGRILDGRNREAACRIAGVEPHYVEADPDDPVDFVVSLNVRRRQLSRDQAAVAAALAWPMYEVGQGKRTDLGTDRAEVRTRDRLARMFDVGVNAVQQAHALRERDPRAFGRVKRGQVRLDSAYRTMLARESREREARRAATPRAPSFDQLMRGATGKPFARPDHGPQPSGWKRPSGWKPPRRASAVIQEEWRLGAEENELAAALERVRDVATELKAGAPLATLYERMKIMCGDESAADWLRGVRDDAASIVDRADAVLLDPTPDEVIERAVAIGHAGLSDRSAARLALAGRPKEAVADWVERGHAELDRFEALLELRAAEAGEDEPPDWSAVTLSDPASGR